MRPTILTLKYLCLAIIIAFVADMPSVAAPPLPTRTLQQLQCTQIDTRRGFNQNTVHAILQTSKGYMIFATPNGAYKYDGYEFERITNIVGDENSLAYSYILRIEEDSRGRFWVLHPKALTLYDESKSSYRRYSSPQINLMRLRSFLLDRQDESRLWFCTDTNVGVIEIDPQTDDIVNVNYPVMEYTDRSTTIRWIKQSRDGTVWVSEGNKLHRYRALPSGKIVSLGMVKNVVALDMQQREDGEILILDNRSISVLEQSEESAEVSLREVVNIERYRGERWAGNKLCFAPNGDLWYVSWQRGIVHIDRGYECQFYPVFEGLNIYESSSLGSAMIDRSGVLWLGSWTSGLLSVNLHHKRFYNIDCIAESRNPKPLYLVNSITGDNRGNVWFGSNNQGVSHFKHDGVSIEGYENISAKCNLKTDRIFSILYFQNALWINDGDGIVKVTFTGSGAIKSSQRLRAENYINKVTCLFGDSNGILWIGDFISGDIHYIDTNEVGAEQIRELATASGEHLSFSSISSLYVDSRGDLWIATQNSGIYRAKINSLKLEQFDRVKFTDPVADFDNNICFSFCEDISGAMWLSSFGGGAVKFRLDDNSQIVSLEHVSTDNGLVDNALYSIVQDKRGRLWFSSDEGISMYDQSLELFKNYDNSDGVNNNNFRKWSAWISSDGKIYFGGTNGVTFFQPEEIDINSYPPIIQISQINVNGRKVTNGKDIFEPTENNVEFRFTALQFDAPEEITYSFKLDGVDDIWRTSTAKQRSITYSNLKAGEYTFRVRARSRDGVYSKEEAREEFTIKPYWYHTWWAIMLYVLALLGVSLWWTMYRRERRKIKNEIIFERMRSENALQLNKAKLEFYTNISHEIKTPLTIMSGIIDNIRKGGAESIDGRNFGVITYNVNRLLQLVGQLLDFRRAVTGNMPFRPVHAELSTFVGEILEQFEEYSLHREIEFSVEMPAEVLSADFDPDKFNKILSNLLSNAFKFTPKGGSITVSLMQGLPDTLPSGSPLRSSENYVTLSIADTGAGISAENINNIFNRFFQADREQNLTDASSGVGVGLSYVKLLTELHGGVVYVDSVVGSGSTFYVVIPASQSGVEIARGGDQDSLLSDIIESSFDSTILDSTNYTTRREITSLPRISNFADREILIVEDNEEIRRFVREFLSPTYKIIEAENGREGYEKAMQYIPDLIISDVMMPEMDGIEMVAQLKAEEKTNHIPIIMLTVNNHIEDRINGLSAGADSYITKPFNVDHLRVRIEKLLALRETLKDKYVTLSGGEKLSEVDLAAEDRDFVEKIEALIEANLSDAQYSISDIESQMNYSKMQLYRKIKSLTGMTGVEFVRNYRLKRSVDMMHTTHQQIREILYDVGFTSPSYYSKCFKARYGVTPTEFMEKIRG